ncbi:hypothetical protein VTN96DRAFT_8529 [Rasamsonia emersonii]
MEPFQTMDRPELWVDSSAIRLEEKVFLVSHLSRWPHSPHPAISLLPIALVLRPPQAQSEDVQRSKREASRFGPSSLSTTLVFGVGTRDVLRDDSFSTSRPAILQSQASVAGRTADIIFQHCSKCRRLLQGPARKVWHHAPHDLNRQGFSSSPNTDTHGPRVRAGSILDVRSPLSRFAVFHCKLVLASRIRSIPGDNRLLLLLLLLLLFLLTSIILCSFYLRT